MITVKEKAAELIEKYLKLDIEIGGQHDGYLTIKMHDVKQCALIAVEEILQANPSKFANNIEGFTTIFEDCQQAIDFYKSKFE